MCSLRPQLARCIQITNALKRRLRLQFPNRFGVRTGARRCPQGETARARSETCNYFAATRSLCNHCARLSVRQRRTNLAFRRTGGAGVGTCATPRPRRSARDERPGSLAVTQEFALRREAALQLYPDPLSERRHEPSGYRVSTGARRNRQEEWESFIDADEAAGPRDRRWKLPRGRKLFLASAVGLSRPYRRRAPLRSRPEGAQRCWSERSPQPLNPRPGERDARVPAELSTG